MRFLILLISPVFLCGYIGGSYDSLIEQITSDKNCVDPTTALYSRSFLDSRVMISINAGVVSTALASANAQVDTCETAARTEFVAKYAAQFQTITELLEENSADHQYFLNFLQGLIETLERKNLLGPQQKLNLYLRMAFDEDGFHPAQIRLVMSTDSQLLDNFLIGKTKRLSSLTGSEVLTYVIGTEIDRVPKIAFQMTTRRCRTVPFDQLSEDEKFSCGFQPRFESN